MRPSMRLDRVFDSFAWVEYFRGTPVGEVVADELEAGLGVSKKKSKRTQVHCSLGRREFVNRSARCLAVVLMIGMAALLSMASRSSAETVATDLGTLGGYTSIANDINNEGQVVGSSGISLSNGTSHAFLWQNGTMTDIGNWAANGINDGGQIVGSNGHAVLWDNGTMTDLGTLGGYTYSSGSDINNVGQVVGISAGPSGWGHAVLWQSGTIRDLGALPGYNFSSAASINDFGDIVGWSEKTTSDPLEATLWHNGTATDLGTLGGA